MKKLLVLCTFSCLLMFGCDKKTEAGYMIADNSAKVEDANQSNAGKKQELGSSDELAELAGPGFNRYIRGSKENEAKENLKTIVDGAIRYYMLEHCADDNCLMMTTGTYPLAEKAVQIGPDVGEATLDKWYSTTPEMLDGVWKQLGFNGGTKLRYTYYYVSDGKQFTVKASASLDGVCDSGFMVKGTTRDNAPYIGRITDLSGNKDEPCNGVEL